MVRYGKANLHEWIYVAGLTLLAISLPVSVFFMSLSQFILVINWLIEGHFRMKWERIRQHKGVPIFLSIYLVYLLGMLYSTDFSDGFSTLRSRLPILMLTLVVVSSNPLPRQRWLAVLLAFSASITVVSLISIYIWLAGNYNDPRELSPFISHIRMGLMVAMSVCLLIWFARRESLRILYLVSGWHIIYLYILHSLTGLIALGAVALAMVLADVYRLRPLWRAAAYTLLVVFFAITFLLTLFLWRNITWQHETELDRLETFTAGGTRYLHDKQATHRENGHLVYIYIAEDELKKAWPRVSRLDFEGQTTSGDELRLVLYRYLTSKGLRKDAKGLYALDQKDILAVEQGITNVLYREWPWFVVRLHQTMWELHVYDQERNPAGHSLTQRLEFWRAAYTAVKFKPLIGWGTGDLRKASAFGLEAIDSPLEFERWMKPHNQYLSFMVKFGLIGGLWVILAMILPVIRQKAWNNRILIAFLIILFISMIHEDTLDTQAGFTFFIFFFNMLLFAEVKNSKPK